MKEIAIMFMVGVAMNAPPAGTPGIRTAPAVCYCELNANVDEGVSLSEYCRRFGLEAEDQFRRADKDDNGLLSEAEYASLEPSPDY